MKQHKKLHLEWAVYFLFALFFFWMAAQIPYTHDDWDWGLDVGLQHLLTANINSRYVGNFIIVVMSRSKVLKTTIMGTFFFLLPWQLSGLAILSQKEAQDKKRLLYFLIAAILMLTISREVWQQTYSWVAGFANYVISASFLLLCIQEWLLELEATDRKPIGIGRNLLFFLICILSQMFLENLALFLTFTSFAVCFLYRRQRGFISRHLMWMAAGSFVGFLIMFSSPIYAPLFDTGFAVDHVRRMSVNPVAGFWGSIYNIFFQCAVLAIRCGEKNVFCSCMALVLLSVAAYRQKSAKPKYTVLICGVNTIILLFFVVSALLNTQYSTVSILRVLLAAFVNAVYQLVVIGEIIYLFRDRKNLMGKLLAFWVGGLGVIIPMIATSENGPRIFLTYLIFIFLFNLVLLDALLINSGRKAHQALLMGCGACVIGLLVFHGVIFGAIGSCMRQREQIFVQHIQNPTSKIVLPQFPYEHYLWNPDPIIPEREVYFREFYGLNPDVEIIVDLR